MQYYDVIIVGAGIAGTGLAYNLSQICPNKSVLVIDKNELGSNQGHSIRILTQKLENYNLNYIHKYDGIKVGAYDNIFFTIKKNVHVIDYKNTCNSFLSQSNAVFKREKAIRIKNKCLETNGHKYNFKYLIDCSGKNFFLRKILNKQLPFRYWLGKVRILKNDNNIKTNYLYHMFNDNGDVEEINPIQGNIAYGLWKYEKKVDFDSIKFQPIYKKLINNLEVLKENNAVIPVTPVLPLRYNNFAFLGDSCGNASSSMAFGVTPTLEASEVLSHAIKKNKLSEFEKIWKKRFINAQVRNLVSKLDRNNNPRFMKYIKNYPTTPEVILKFRKYPSLFFKLMENYTFSYDEIPKDILRIYPKRQKLFQLYYYIFLKLKYMINSF